MGDALDSVDGGKALDEFDRLIREGVCTGLEVVGSGHRLAKSNPLAGHDDLAMALDLSMNHCGWPNDHIINVAISPQIIRS